MSPETTLDKRHDIITGEQRQVTGVREPGRGAESVKAGRSVSKSTGATLGDRLPSVLYLLVSIGLLAILWQTLSWLLGASVLPSPWVAVSEIRYSHEQGYLWSDIGVTAYRVFGAFLIALTVSVAAGALLGRSRTAERLFGQWVTIGASIPALVYVVVVYLAVGLNNRAAMVGTALVVAPVMTFAIWDGMRAINPEFQEMARAFRMPKPTILRRVILPQTTPFVFTAARSGLSLTWRIMIFVELLGLSSGVGYRIQYWYSLFNMERVLAAAIPFIALMLAFEFGVLRPLEDWVFRWRKAELH